MDIQEKGKTTLSTVLIVALIGSLIGYIIPDIFEPFYKWLQSIISYKLLLTMWLLTALLTMYTLKTANHHKSLQPKLTRRQKKRDEERLLQSRLKRLHNLSKIEKIVLSEYFKKILNHLNLI